MAAVVEKVDQQTISAGEADKEASTEEMFPLGHIMGDAAHYLDVW